MKTPRLRQYLGDMPKLIEALRTRQGVALVQQITGWSETNAEWCTDALEEAVQLAQNVERRLQ